MQCAAPSIQTKKMEIRAIFHPLQDVIEVAEAGFSLEDSTPQVLAFERTITVIIVWGSQSAQHVK